MHEGSNFSTSRDRHTSHLDGPEVVSHCGPDFFLTPSLPSGNETMVGLVTTDQRNPLHLALGRKAARSGSTTGMNSVFSTDSSCVLGPFADGPAYSPSCPRRTRFRYRGSETSQEYFLFKHRGGFSQRNRLPMAQVQNSGRRMFWGGAPLKLNHTDKSASWKGRPRPTSHILNRGHIPSPCCSFVYRVWN